MNGRLERLPGRRELDDVGECPGCRGGALQTLRRHVAEDGDPALILGLLESGDEIRFELCWRCGLVFKAPRYSESTLDRYYTVTCPANEPVTLPFDRLTNQRYIRREQARFARLARLVWRHCPEPSVVVDIGALDGASLRPYLDRGARGIAIDPGSDARDRADPRIESVHSLEKLGTGEAQPDVILSTQTFEHLRSPGLVAEAALRAVRDGGLLVIEVPYDLVEMRFLWDLALPVDPGHAEHVNFFTSESLAGLIPMTASVVEVAVGAQIHKYGGLIPSVTVVARSDPPGLSARRELRVTPERIRSILDHDRLVVRNAQRGMKLAGMLTRRGRW